MGEITLRQEEYLLFFAERNGRNASITAAAEQFEVSKPTVCRFTNLLEEHGLIRKNSYGEIELTETGWTYITPRLQTQREVSEWMVTGLGLLPNTADQEARRMVTNLEPETVRAILQVWEKTKQTSRIPPEDIFFSHLPVGRYQLQFRLMKRGQDTRSMGDRGFQHPACLIRDTGGCEVRLYPRQIEYRPFQRCRIYLGTVDRLWYKLGEVWREAKVGPDGGYGIPGAALKRPKEDQKGCMVPIRIRATIHQGAMPESEADLVFELDSIAEEAE